MPNLRSADRPLLDGRAMIHLTISNTSESITENVSIFMTATQHEGRGIQKGVNIGIADNVTESKIRHRIPICCSAFRRGRVISARLLRSPVSSDCAFTPEGCSVSSRYPFPGRGLARRFLLAFDTISILKQCSLFVNDLNS